MPETVQSSSAPNPEVLEKPKRRVFSKTYKLRILQEIDQAAEFGQVGAILRREGLYHSHLVNWRRQRQNGELQPQKSAKQTNSSHDKKLRQLQNENQKLRKELKQAQAIIEVQKKFSDLLKISLPANEFDGSSKS